MHYKNLNFVYLVDLGTKLTGGISKIRKAFPEFSEMDNPAKGVYLLHKGALALGISPTQIMCVLSGEESININEIVNRLNKVLEVLDISGQIRLGLKVEGYEKVDISSKKLSLSAHKQEAEILGAVGIGYRFIINNSFVHGDIKIEPYLKDDKQILYDVLLQTLDGIPISEAEQGFHNLFVLATENSRKVSSTLFFLKADGLC
ncbi:MAG: hypothetical protein ACYDEJ_08950 [Desulfitobacteriaceae bacterium]